MTRLLYTLVPALALSLLLSLANPAWAQDQQPEPIQHLKNKGLDIVRDFPVGTALTGWVVSYQGKDFIVYTTADGEFLINGVLLDAQGNDLTDAHQKEWLPRPSWEDLASSHFITEKSLATDQKTAQSTLYLFYDANCPFCHLAWLALQAYRQVGLEIRWIPVAYLKPDSRDKAAALLSAPKNQQAALLEKSMQAFGSNTTSFNKTPSEQDKQQLQANMDLMQAFGLNGTPGWVWLNTEGQLQTHSGMLRLPKLPEVTGLPEQKHTEPTLMRFR